LRTRAILAQRQNNIVEAVRKGEHHLHIPQVRSGNELNGITRMLKRASRLNILGPFPTFAKKQVRFAILQDDFHI